MSMRRSWPVYLALVLVVAFLLWAILALFAHAQVQQIPPVSAGGGGAGDDAPQSAQYWLGSADALLLQAKNLGALTNGLVLNTGGTPSTYGGAACTNQVIEDLSAAGVPTCVSVTGSHIASNTITDTNVAAANKDGVAGTASMRTLGSGATQAAGGTDARFPTSDQKSALAGSSGTPNAGNPYVTTDDPRMPLATSPAALSAASQISCSRPTMIIQGSGGAVTLTSPQPIIAGTFSGQRCQLVGGHATNSVTLSHGTNLVLPGLTGTVTVIPGGASPEFTWNGTVWVLTGGVLTSQLVGQAGASRSIGACGTATNPTFTGGGGNTIEFCLTGTTPTVRMLCGGTDCTSTTLVNPRFAFSGAKPTCDATLAGSEFPYWGTRAGAAKDKMELCAKLANDTYAWSEVLN